MGIASGLCCGEGFERFERFLAVLVASPGEGGRCFVFSLPHGGIALRRLFLFSFMGGLVWLRGRDRADMHSDDSPFFCCARLLPSRGCCLSDWGRAVADADAPGGPWKVTWVWGWGGGGCWGVRPKPLTAVDFCRFHEIR